MPARAALQSLLEADLATGQPLAEIGFEAAYGSNAVDTPPEQRFIIVRWEDTTRAFGHHGPQRVTIWFHDRDQDYARIDAAIEHVKTRLAAVVHRYGADRWIMTQADWRGDSQDLIDDGFRTQTRNSGFDIVSRYDSA